MSKSYFNIREALEIGTDKIVDQYKKATPGEVVEAPEDDMPASPDEAGMAIDQAKFIRYVAEEIMEYIQGNNEFPEWMQNKLSAFHEKAKGMHAVMAGKYESVEESFKPHMMYDPKTGKAYKAEKPEDHERMAKMGYSHEKPDMNEDVRKMSHSRLKFHMNNKNIPHGSYSWDQMKAERDRRLKTGEGDAYKKAKMSMSEEVELDEKLSVDDGMKKWIEDFQKSDAPQFKGMDKNERREMAIAAYLAAKRRDKKED